MATAKNTAAHLFAAATNAQDGSDATHFSVWDMASGGNWLFNIAFSNNPDPIEEGGRYRIAANAVVITQPKATAESDESAIRSLKGKLDGNTHWQLHSGDPGAAGTTAAISGFARLSLADTDFTYAA